MRKNGFAMQVLLLLGVWANLSLAVCARTERLPQGAPCQVASEQVYECDTFTTGKGHRVAVTFIKHGTLRVDVDGFVIHIDPVGMFGTDYDAQPKADLVLVTHEHGDHFDSLAIAKVWKPSTEFLSNGRVAELSRKSRAMKIGESLKVNGGLVVVTATAAYNTTPAHKGFHPKGRDVGFLIDVDDLRMYIGGDTEDIPEMAGLKEVDVAFLPVNQPYTMTPAQCIRAIEMFMPKIVYPYHYGETDLTPVIDHFAHDKNVEIRIRQLQ